MYTNTHLPILTALHMFYVYRLVLIPLTVCDDVLIDCSLFMPVMNQMMLILTATAHPNQARRVRRSSWQG
jgi:hypothetical protein